MGKMISPETKQAIVELKSKGVKIRKISRILKVSRNTVRMVVRGKHKNAPESISGYQEIMPIIKEQFQFCKGNAVRVHENLIDQYDENIPYSTLNRLIRDMELRDKKKQRSGEYMFNPGREVQHDTSPHGIIFGDKKKTAQCAGLVLAYSKKLFIQYYPNFTRFEAKVFLTEAFKFFDGSCPRCIVDNTHVVVARGSGPDAEIAPEMEAFGRIFNTYSAHQN